MESDIRISLDEHMEAMMSASVILSKLVREGLGELEEEDQHLTAESLFYSCLNIAKCRVQIPWIIVLIYIEEGDEKPKDLPIYMDRIAELRAQKDFRFNRDRPISKAEKSALRTKTIKKLVSEKDWSKTQAATYSLKWFLDLPSDVGTQTQQPLLHNTEAQTDSGKGENSHKSQ